MGTAGAAFRLRDLSMLDETFPSPYVPNMGMPNDAIALPAELERRVRQLATETGVSPGQIMIDAIGEYVADLEDSRIARARLDSLRAGQTDTVPLEELMARYGVAD